MFPGILANNLNTHNVIKCSILSLCQFVNLKPTDHAVFFPLYSFFIEQHIIYRVGNERYNVLNYNQRKVLKILC